MSCHPFKNSTELDAFKRVFETVNERLPTTSWIFETGDNLLLGNNDVKHAEQSLPHNNLQRHELELENGTCLKFVSLKAEKCYARLLQHILIVARYRVEIYGMKNKTYNATKKASPCDLSEVVDLMGEDEDGHSDSLQEKMLDMGGLCAITVEGDAKSSRIGISFWHEHSKTAKITEFFDNFNLDKLESVLVQHNPMEAIISSQSKLKMVRKLLERNKILCTTMASKSSSASKSVQDIERLLKSKNVQDKPIAVKAFALLCNHLQVDIFQIIEHKGIEFLNDEDFVNLDSEALTGLNIFETPHQAMSLFKVLNKTRTSGGARLLKVWLRQPLTDVGQIRERLEIVDVFVNDSEARKTVHEQTLPRITDLERLSIKVEEKKNTLLDLYKCYQGAREIGNLVECLKKMDSKLINQIYIIPIGTILESLSKFIELVEVTLDLEAIGNHEGVMINPTFDDDLMRLSTAKKQIKSKMDSTVDVVAGILNLEAKKVKLEFTSQHGYTFRLSMNDEKKARNGLKEMIIVDTKNAGVRFRNGKLDHLNREYLKIASEFESQQQYVMKEIYNVTCNYAPYFSKIGRIMSHLDVLVGFSQAAVVAPIGYSKPTLVERDDETSILKLVEARHPCLELLDNMNFIPNSIEFKKDKRFCIITGPNLGGKSTFLRSIALNVLMAQVGSFVASREATIFPCDRILVRIGAGDSQLQGVSTFMAEMLEASHICRTATQNSLILIDELGRGTSTYDGLGLAWAISEHIAKTIRAPCLFATHFHEITQLAQSYPDIVFNCFVDAMTSDEQFTLLYQVRDGSSNKSFGLEVARLAGFPQVVLDDAKTYLETAEMPLLRNSKGFGGEEVASFISTYSQTNDKKRKQELLVEMKAKMAKLID